MMPRIYLIMIYVYFLLHNATHEKHDDSMVQMMNPGNQKTESHVGGKSPKKGKASHPAGSADGTPPRG